MAVKIIVEIMKRRVIGQTNDSLGVSFLSSFLVSLVLVCGYMYYASYISKKCQCINSLSCANPSLPCKCTSLTPFQVYFFGSKITKNESNLENIYQVFDIEPPSPENIRNLSKYLGYYQVCLN